MRIPQDANPLWKFLHGAITVARPLIGSIHVEGQANVPRTGGVILAANHPGGLDVFALGYASPRQIYYMAKQELFKINPLLTRGLYAVGAFPVRRGHQDVGAVGTSIRIVRQGKVLGMFIEGTRNHDRGLSRGRNGAIRIALKTGAPVVPAALIGITGLNRDWRNLLRRSSVTVRFGEPISFPQDESVSSEVLQAYTDQVMEAIAALLPVELRGIYAEGTLPPSTP